MHVFSGIGAELTLFMESVALGAFMLFLYDFLRVFRRALRHGIIWISIEDFLFWILLSGWFFLHVCTKNDGIIRFYMLVGMAAGAFICHLLVGRYFIHYMTIFIRKLKKGLKKTGEIATMKLKKRKEARKEHGSKKTETPP